MGGLTSLSKDRATLTGATVCAVLLLLLCLPVLDRPGMQTDETLFAAGIYGPYDESNVVSIGGLHIPLMLMTYVGTFKSLLYRPIVAVFGTSPWAIRLPGVLLSSLSVFAFTLLLVEVTKVRAALLAGAVLATDPIYVLYSRWDHGPVVTLHLLLVMALLSYARFFRDHRLRWLALGSLCLGLALWEKAVFMWLLAGMALSLPIAFGLSGYRRHSSPRSLLVAAAFFAIGALPLFLYNIRHSMVTFRSNARLDTTSIKGKTELLRHTFEGNALFGSMMREPWDGPAKDPAHPLDAAIANISKLTAERRKGCGLWIFGICLLVLPFARNFAGAKFGLFALVAGSLAFAQMLFTKGAGTAAHHTILLWPLPYVITGISLAYLWAKSRRPAFKVVLTLFVLACCVSNLLVLATYYRFLIRNGGTDSWTEAMYPSLAYIRSTDKSAVGVVDWGFLDTVRLSEQGRTPIFALEDPATASDKDVLRRIVETPNIVFISHSDGHETFPGITARLFAFAELHGYTPADVRKFFDYNGRYTVRTFRFQKARDAGGGVQVGRRFHQTTESDRRTRAPRGSHAYAGMPQAGSG